MASTPRRPHTPISECCIKRIGGGPIESVVEVAVNVENGAYADMTQTVRDDPWMPARAIRRAT